jgi:phosphate transport system ATP-binding protein
MAKLRISNLSIRYGDVRAVTDVTLEIPEGKITAIVGPSGCGKSSFLQALNRLTDLIPGCEVSGSVKLGDQCIFAAPALDTISLRKRVGMVFQRPNPFPQSIRRNFEIPLREHGTPKREIPRILERALTDVALWDEVSARLNQNAATLSGGQQQRLCIARALALNPEVILFDEPCSALDPIASMAVEKHIQALRGRFTIVIVTHNLAQARRLADSVAVFWLRNGSGRLIETGPADDVLSQPRDPDVASYLNGVNG